jgi:phosphatidylglycerophosphatase A
VDNPVRTLRGILRRLLFAAPGMGRVAGRGVDPGAFAMAAKAEGLVVDASDPEGWVVWAPGEVLCDPLPVGTNVQAVAIVAAKLEIRPLPHTLSCRKARVSMTLREWVSRWPLARSLRPFLASEAVGGRSCTASLPGNSEWIFTASPQQTGALLSREGRKRELAVTLFGIGLFPVMPATLACAVMLPVALLIHSLAGSIAFAATALAVTIAATIAAVSLEPWAAGRFLARDPREFVLDEVAGMAFAWALLPPETGWIGILAAFFLFRIFDIFKWGVDWVEGLPVRGGIVWDDLLAGLYAGLCCRVGETVWGRFF